MIMKEFDIPYNLIIFPIVTSGAIYYFSKFFGMVVMFGWIILMLVAINSRLQQGQYKKGAWK